MSGTGTGIKEREKIKFDFSLPKEYSIIIYDDDTTPVEFVAMILVVAFGKNEAQMNNIISAAQEHGSAVVMTASKDVVETKLEEVRTAISSTPFELRFDMVEA